MKKLGLFLAFAMVGASAYGMEDNSNNAHFQEWLNVNNLQEYIVAFDAVVEKGNHTGTLLVGTSYRKLNYPKNKKVGDWVRSSHKENKNVFDVGKIEAVANEDTEKQYEIIPEDQFPDGVDEFYGFEPQKVLDEYKAQRAKEVDQNNNN